MTLWWIFTFPLKFYEQLCILEKKVLSDSYFEAIFCGALNIRAIIFCIQLDVYGKYQTHSVSSSFNSI